MNNDNLILSPELQQELADIRDIISEKYRQFLQQQESSRRAENNDAANLYSNAVDVLEPLFLFDKYMNTQSGFNKDDLEQYGSLLRSAMSDLSVIYNNLENLNEANDALFVNMNLLDEKVDNFIVRLNGDLEKNPQREMKAKDVVQSQTDDKRKLESELQQQDKAKDKQGAKKENTEESRTDKQNDFSKDIKFTNQYTDNVDKPEKSVDEKIAEFQRIDKMFDRTHPAESFKKMMFGIRDAVRAGVVSQDQVRAYKSIFDEIKKSKNFERGILDLSAELNVQMSELKDAEKARSGKYDKSSKFKDGIVNVLNKQRQEQSQENIDKKSVEEKRALLLKKKLLGKTVVD